MKDATVLAREIQDLAGAMSDSMTSVGETLKAGIAVVAGNRQIAEGQSVQLQVPAPVIQLPPPQIDVVVNVPDQAPPTVNVTATPEVRVEGPTVNVAAADPVAYRVTITRRDKDGMIAEFVCEPVRIEG